MIYRVFLSSTCHSMELWNLGRAGNQSEDGGKGVTSLFNLLLMSSNVIAFSYQANIFYLQWSEWFRTEVGKNYFVY